MAPNSPRLSHTPRRMIVRTARRFSDKIYLPKGRATGPKWMRGFRGKRLVTSCFGNRRQQPHLLQPAAALHRPLTSFRTSSQFEEAGAGGQ